MLKYASEIVPSIVFGKIERSVKAPPGSLLKFSPVVIPASKWPLSRLEGAKLANFLSRKSLPDSGVIEAAPPRSFATGLEAAAQVPQIDEEDELHDDEASEEPAEAGGVLLDEAHQLVEEIVVALGAGHAEVVAAVAEREDLVEGVADARRRRVAVARAGHVRAELLIARVLHRDLDVGAHAVHTPSGARAVACLRVVARAVDCQVELRVAAALLVEGAHEALDVGKSISTESALVAAIVLALQRGERLVGHVLDDVDPPAEEDGQGHLHDEQQEPDDPHGRHGLVRAALDADERGGAHEEEHEAEREEDGHDRLADESGHLLA
eukprot:scaffold55292_cov60-Phaeocystis_antarctica.AAC.5